MKRLSGELFWCHVSGRALDPAAPHAAGIWAFEDLSSRRRLSVDLTPREREVLTHVIAGKRNKVIAAEIGTTEKTVKVHRGRIMEKMRVKSVAELVRTVVRGVLKIARNGVRSSGGSPRA